MILAEVNVLVYAHREDAPDHDRYRTWLESILNSSSEYGVSDLVFSGFLRVVTSPRIFVRPSPLSAAFRFVDEMRERPNSIVVAPGERHWEIFNRLCQECDARGNLSPDAYHAALAIESGSEWITTDRDYARFRGLRWSYPLKA